MEKGVSLVLIYSITEPASVDAANMQQLSSPSANELSQRMGNK